MDSESVLKLVENALEQVRKIQANSRQNSSGAPRRAITLQSDELYSMKPDGKEVKKLPTSSRLPESNRSRTGYARNTFDVCEMFSPPRATLRANQRGMRGGGHWT